ncbi:hypothetical protein Trad_2311 [Truepera radiovictrix DSM 17093]|uniref:Uncharacterized protein n=1 Tax=Truepera radiovictrix (strain DSM 17093 / CIP 108686 / LMG 22925 / RQ-24) TaxID=649638 RepID=D7CSK1_TRURR|nr:hypothetical protein Trad_2311 [Truepera radiovictrix DSM 17093]
MIGAVPRTRVDEPLVAHRVALQAKLSPHPWGFAEIFKLVAHRVLGIDKAHHIFYNLPNPKNPARRQAERGSPVRKEVNSVLYGSLADEDLVQLVADAARAARVRNLAQLLAELRLRLAEYRLLEQHGAYDADAWDDTS